MNHFYGVMIKWVSYQDAWLYSILDTHYCKRELVIKSPSTIKGTQVTNLVQFHLSPILNKRCHRLLWINCDYPKYFCIIGTYNTQFKTIFQTQMQTHQQILMKNTIENLGKNTLQNWKHACVKTTCDNWLQVRLQTWLQTASLGIYYTLHL